MSDQEYVIRTVLYWGLSIYVWIGVFWGVDFVKTVYRKQKDNWNAMDNIIAVSTVLFWPWMLYSWKKFWKKHKEELKDGSEDR